jgi:hypothetical protein
MTVSKFTEVWAKVFTPEYMQSARLQMVKANVAARQVAKKRGYTLDPRIAKAKLK